MGVSFSQTKRNLVGIFKQIKVFYPVTFLATFNFIFDLGLSLMVTALKLVKFVQETSSN